MKVLLIGDYCTDVYIYGRVSRISPEAPVPIFDEISREQKPGMAGNVLENMRSLGVVVDHRFPSLSDTIKTRFVDEASGQHFLRVDSNDYCEEYFEDRVDESLYDAVIVSDYNKGYITYSLLSKLQEDCTRIPVFIDTKKTNLSIIQNNNFFVKVNEPEYHSLKSHPSNMIITRGGNDVLYNNIKYSVPRIPVLDVTGAGDTFISALTYKYVNTRSIDESIQFAIRAASVSVTKRGVYAPSLDEIG